MATIAQGVRYKVIWGVGAGAGAALAMMIVMGALRLLLNFPTIPELMLNTILKVTGGQTFSTLLDQLYYSGRPLLFAMILEGTLMLGVGLGLLYTWYVSRNRAGILGSRPFNSSPLMGALYGLLIGVLLNTVFLMLVDQPAFADQAYGLYSESPLPLWLGLMLLALVFGLSLHSLLPKLPVPAAVAEGETVVTYREDRRQFLKIAGGTLLAVLGGAGFWFGGTVLNQGGITSPVTRPVDTEPEEVAQAAEETPTTGSAGQAAEPTPEPPQPTDTPEPLPTDTSEPPTATVQAQEPTAEPTTPPTPEPTLEPTAAPTNTPQPKPAPAIAIKEVTPSDSFYHVSKNFFDPSPSSNGWVLKIGGKEPNSMVGAPYTLTYEQLTSLPAVEVTTGMMCISNPVGGGLIGSCQWKGVPMSDLLKRVKVKKGAVDVVMRAADDYADSFPYKKALDEDVMVVWEMNGAPLNATHGFPARVLVPGIYGMKHVKWLQSIDVVNADFKGYWQEPSQGWSDPAPVLTMSRIDLPAGSTLNTKKQTIQGVAFAGDRSISKVEVSTDGGKTWNDAYVKPPLSGTSWVVWAFEWTPPTPGKYKVQVRATDGAGALQVAKRAEPYPNGATGYHSVSYNVK